MATLLDWASMPETLCMVHEANHMSSTQGDWSSKEDRGLTYHGSWLALGLEYVHTSVVREHGQFRKQY